MDHRFTGKDFLTELGEFEALKGKYAMSLGKACDDSLLVGLMFNKIATVLPMFTST